jgi:hypothetical protein
MYLFSSNRESKWSQSQFVGYKLNKGHLCNQKNNEPPVYQGNLRLMGSFRSQEGSRMQYNYNKSEAGPKGQ